ncbi:MAG: hypothetical protein ACE149_09395 [Armatimonadota bacterium]
MRRRVAALVVGALVWTLVAMYPNPAVPFRNVARYRHLPLDPSIEKRMGWDLPDNPGEIEQVVDSFIVATPDWVTYRVPWYVPTAEEAARATHGDCETKTVLLASLLEGKKIPYEVRASFSHIWVDYQGRKERAGESRDVAYLEGKQGRLRVHWPGRVALRELIAAQREQLWEPMPLARKAIWLLGLAWVVLAAVLLGGRVPEGELVSRWRLPVGSYVGRVFWLSFLTIVAIIAAPAVWRRGEPVTWQFVDLEEALVLAALTGAFLAWVQTVRPRRAVSTDVPGQRLVTRSSFGVFRRAGALEAAAVDHFELAASPGGLRPWRISAARQDGRRVGLLRYSRETEARGALRRLGQELGKPVLVRSEGREYWTPADEIALNLRERAAGRPKQEPPVKPSDCFLVEQEGERWTLGHARQSGGASRALLLLAGIVAGFVAATTVLLALVPQNMVARVVWIGGAILLGMVVYGAMALREEVLAALTGAHVEVGDGELSFHDADGRVESLPLAEVESVEIGRKGETPTIAVVSPERVLHLRLYPQPKHLEWVRGAVEGAVARG